MTVPPGAGDAGTAYPGLDLTAAERSLLRGEQGSGAALAMRIVCGLAGAMGASALRPIDAAHVDGCLYHGPSSLEFVRAVAADGARVRVPTTLNIGGIDLRNPDSFLGPAAEGAAAAELMTAYVDLGCAPTFTCAPYQLPGRPGLGTHVAWAESNAIVFANSVLGARTSRYGDFIDICAAVTGRVPDAGLHLTGNRAARRLFRLAADDLVRDPHLVAALLGHVVGRRTGDEIPAVVGLDPAPVDETWLQAFGAAAASSGGVAMFHVVGVTPEAATLEEATQGRPDLPVEDVTAADLRQALGELSTVPADGPLGAISLGTPHMSADRMTQVAAYFAGRRARVPALVSTSRSAVARNPRAAADLVACGVRVVTDTCTYVSRVMEPSGPVMTDSAKWAYYAPGNQGYDVVLASWRDCVDSAVAGRIVRTEPRDA